MPLQLCFEVPQISDICLSFVCQWHLSKFSRSTTAHLDLYRQLPSLSALHDNKINNLNIQRYRTILCYHVSLTGLWGAIPLALSPFSPCLNKQISILSFLTKWPTKSLFLLNKKFIVLEKSHVGNAETADKVIVYILWREPSWNILKNLSIILI